MTASMWRMNGLWRRMAGVLVLCALLLSNEVMCQDDVTAAPAPAADASAVTNAAASAAAPAATAAQDAGATATAAVGGESAASAAPGDSPFATTILNILSAAGTTAAPVVIEVLHIVKTVVPEVTCVGNGVIPEGDAVTAEMGTTDCDNTKRIIEENPANWCSKENCSLRIYQNGKTALVASDDANLATLAEALESEQLKDKLGVTKTETPSSSGSSVFVGILVTGLLAALAITAGYLKCQRRTDTKGVRLAEEAHPADQENQGNTLVSVAPLNPPTETPEKPSVNGETPEADKTQTPPPPTNGHSTIKTADTEL